MGQTIAVIEDDECMQALLVALLQARGWSVEPFDSVRDAAQALGAAPPDLMIVDVNLPDGCGLDLIGEVRDRTGRTVPAIVLSGLCEERDIARGFAAGAIDFMAKPFRREELLARCSIQLARAATPTAPAPAPSACVATDRSGAPLPLVGGLAFGRYTVMRELGRGGQGCVLLAEDQAQGGALVALKVIQAGPEQDEASRTRFVRETYALARVRHPGVVQIYDVGVFKDHLYYAMEYVPGVSLRDHTEAAPLGADEAGAFARGMLEALAALSDADVIHRDLKPENIVLRDGRIDRPVIIDFGLARGSVDRAITSPEIIIGTPGYLAPEVIDGQDPTHQSDLFALGMTLRFALLCEEAYPHLSGVALLGAVARRQVTIPTCLEPGVQLLLRGLLQLDPARRWATAQSALAALPELGRRSARQLTPARWARPTEVADPPARL
jgi:CheY-like chemotaxis protein